MIGAYTADSVAAACPVENGTVFWSASVGSYMMTATQQVITVYAHANGGCAGATALAGGGTAHMSTNGGGLIEMGYRDTRHSDGSHSFQLFTEETIGGSETVTLRNSPGCAVAGRAVTFK